MKFTTCTKPIRSTSNFAAADNWTARGKALRQIRHSAQIRPLLFSNPSLNLHAHDSGPWGIGLLACAKWQKNSARRETDGRPCSSLETSLHRREKSFVIHLSTLNYSLDINLLINLTITKRYQIILLTRSLRQNSTMSYLRYSRLEAARNLAYLCLYL